MGMMLKPRYNRRNGWEKDLFDQKKSTDESVKDQGDAGCVFLIGKALSVMNMYHVVRWYKKQFYQEVLARLRYAVRRMRPELW